MAILTSFLKLLKPERNDYVDVEKHISENYDKIDVKVQEVDNANKSNSNSINNLQQNLTRKSDIGHKHNTLTIRNGSNTIQYDGSTNKEILIETGGGVPGAHSHTTNDIVYLTGYNKGAFTGALNTADSLNKALAKLENNLDSKAALSHSHSGYAAISHYHGSNSINYMSGYYKHNSGGAINTSDSLNTAIGKLEKNLDSKAGTVHKHSMLRIRNGFTYIEYDGTSEQEINIQAGSQTPAAHVHASNEITLMSGYNRSSYTGAINTSDNLNRALAKLENGIESLKNTSITVNWNDIRDKPSVFAPSSHYQSSETITTMSGYIKNSLGGKIQPYDSLNTAIGKLEKNLDDKASINDTLAQLNTKADKTHYHDERYYTETEVNNLVNAKLDKTGGTISGSLTVQRNTIVNSSLSCNSLILNGYTITIE